VKNKAWLTEYYVRGLRYEGLIEASDKEMAQLGCDWRRPGEKVVGEYNWRERVHGWNW